MAIDILNIQPSTISRDLKGKYILIYSLPKVGKTSLACQFPNNLLLGFEHGWNAISGAKAIDVTKWADFKVILRQLEKQEAKEMYDTITIDTAAIAWDKCEEYICSQNAVQKLSDISWGAGFAACSKEYENCLRRITQLGYGLVLIAHVDKRIEKVGDNEIEYISPALNKRAYAIANQIVDIIGYISIDYDEEGNSERWLYTRKTPRIMAGSRFKYLAPKVKFGYQELVDAISDAIEKQQKLDGATVVDNRQETEDNTTEKMSYKDIRSEASELWQKLVEKNEENARRILKKVEMTFGRKLKLSEITEDQADLFYLVLLDMRDMLDEE